MITHARNQKKDIHIAYFDVIKAYDKAWVDAIMYVMYKEGLRDNHWTIAWKLNQNLIATVNTVMQFGLLIDETSMEITKENLGIQLEGLKQP